MKIINDISKETKLAFGKQNRQDHSDYRFLNYIMRVPYDEGTILHNFLTSQTLFLNQAETADLDVWQNKELFTFLIESWILVPKRQDDRQMYDSLFPIAKMMQKKHSICSFTIFPTTDCNARCFYCFENGRKRYHMTEQTALDVAKYIIRVSKGAPVHILWFGGEPLYNSKIINLICNYLLINNVKLNSTMISNGYLFDEQLIQHAKNDWKLSRVQITLDGTRDIYNQVKNYIYKDDPDPFSRIINNINNLLKCNITVNIRINLDKHNVDDIYSLVDYIDEHIGSHPNLLVYSWLLYDSRLSGNNKRAIETKKMLTEKQIALSQYIIDKKLRFVKPMQNSLTLKACMGEDEAAVIIFPDGRIGKCDHYLESNFIGSIYSDEPFDTEIMKLWTEKRPEVPLCKTCCLLPYCRKLKNCPEFGEQLCDEIEQSFYLNHTKQRIIEAYKKS